MKTVSTQPYQLYIFQYPGYTCLFMLEDRLLADTNQKLK